MPKQSDYVSYDQATDERLRGKTGAQKEAEGVARWASETTGTNPPQGLANEFQSVMSILEPNPQYLEKKGRNPKAYTRNRSLNINIPGFNQLNTLNQQQLLAVIAEIQALQLSAVYDIANYTQPLSQITVSGTNAISNADEPEVVVPGSDSANIASKSLFIEADPTNTDDIYIGNDGVEPDSGYVLGPGDSIDVDIDLRQEQLYMASSSSGQQVDLLGMI